MMVCGALPWQFQLVWLSTCARNQRWKRGHGKWRELEQLNWARWRSDHSSSDALCFTKQGKVLSAKNSWQSCLSYFEFAVSLLYPANLDS